MLAVSYGPTWGWHSATVLGLFAATAVLLGLWMFSENRSGSPLVDMRMMRIPAVWSTNLAALLFGFGMFAMFITVPQFAQTPTSAGYGFGASVTQSGLYLLPFAVGDGADRTHDRPALEGGRVKGRAGRGRAVLGGVLLVVDPAPQQPWTIYAAAGLLGVGVALGYASMANLIIEAVPVEQTGVATGMNTNIRNIGAALGSGVATSLVIGEMLPNGYPKEAGYVLAFAASGIAMLIAALAALMIPRREGPSIVSSEAHPALIAEAEVVVGAIAFAPEEPV